MEMAWIRHNLDVKQNFLTESIFDRQLLVALINLILLIFIITINILSKNAMKQNNGNKTCHICHINARNTAYLITSTFRFKRLKYIQNVRLKNSGPQKLNYI